MAVCAYTYDNDYIIFYETWLRFENDDAPLYQSVYVFEFFFHCLNAFILTYFYEAKESLIFFYSMENTQYARAQYSHIDFCLLYSLHVATASLDDTQKWCQSQQ